MKGQAGEYGMRQTGDMAGYGQEEGEGASRIGFGSDLNGMGVAQESRLRAGGWLGLPARTEVLSHKFESMMEDV